MNRDLSLHWIPRPVVQRLRLVLLTSVTLAAQCLALSDFRLSAPAALLLFTWLPLELLLRWLSD